MRIGLACLALSLLAACQRDAASEDPSATKTLAGADAESRTIADRGDAARVLCSAEEQAIFSCKVDNGKRLAVCATAHGKAQYRYGETTHELVLDGTLHDETIIHPLKEVDGSAMTWAQTPEQVVEILKYVTGVH